MKAPNKCPICGNKEKWICVDKSKKGFSTGKAITGGLLLGGIGLYAIIVEIAVSSMNTAVNPSKYLCATIYIACLI